MGNDVDVQRDGYPKWERISHLKNGHRVATVEVRVSTSQGLWKLVAIRKGRFDSGIVHR